MTISEGFEMKFVRAEDAPARLPVPGNVYEEAFQSSFSSEDETPEAVEGDDSLSDAAESERDYVRRRLREESGREPSEEEVDEWLRRHTEGY
jgi:hypothetical protein